MSIVSLLVILAVGAALRLEGLDREGYWQDEYSQTQLYDLSIHHTMYYAATRHAFGPPDFIIGWLAYRLSPTVWMCRFPSAVWGVVAIGACFFLARRLFGWKEGLIAATLLTLSPLHLTSSQEARPYSICLAFMLITLVLLLRAFERPTGRRLILFGVVAFVTVMTRSFTPAVLLLVIGIVLTCAMLRIQGPPNRLLHTPLPTTGAGQVALKRTWIAVIVAGAFAMPAVAFMYITCYAGEDVQSKLDRNSYGIDPQYTAKLARYALLSGRTMLENFGPIVMSFAALGVALTLASWRRLRSDRRTVLAALLLAGPAVLAIYAAVGGTHLYYARYSFYLVPICAIFAAMATTSVTRALSHLSRAVPLNRAMIAVALVALLVYPVTLAAEYKSTRHQQDWRGCAAYLADFVTTDDVVMVLTDAPFGRVQNRFYGKYEWPKERRPLGEAMWTLAISDSHFQRLRRKTGQVYTVIAYYVDKQPPDKYLSMGLQDAPPGFELVKFRGLDLLIRDQPADELGPEVVAICDALLTLTLTNPSTSVVPLTLRSRMLGYLGDSDESERSLVQAISLVPPIQIGYFGQSTSNWQQRS